MSALVQFPGAQTPAQRVLTRYSRQELAGFIEVAIGLLDLADGDPDLEDDDPDDEHDGRERDDAL